MVGAAAVVMRREKREEEEEEEKQQQCFPSKLPRTHAVIVQHLKSTIPPTSSATLSQQPHCIFSPPPPISAQTFINNARQTKARKPIALQSGSRETEGVSAAAACKNR